MKLKKVVLDNFRCFEHLEMDFDKQLTVIVGGNGAGKTAVLDGIALLFGPFFTQLPGISGIAPRLSDPRILTSGKQAPVLRCYAEANTSTEWSTFQNEPAPTEEELNPKWSIVRLRDKTQPTKLQAKKLSEANPVNDPSQLGCFAQELVIAEMYKEALSAPYQMPLVVYYGTNRAVLSTPLNRHNFKKQFHRFDSLDDALKPAANFKRVFEWFHAKENEEARELKKRQALDYTDPSLDCVRRAITTFFHPKFQNPRTELRPLRFMVDWKDGDNYIPLDLNQLSDGYRTTLALVADLARRMVEANPPGTIDDPLDTEAIVLIDEVDLHLHPAWQQRILMQLQETFPKSQFIVTTHSPQVLSTVPAECIRIVDNGRVFAATPGTEGAESARLLKQIFGVELRPPDNEFTGKLFRYRDLVYADQWESEEAVALRKELDVHFRKNEPLLLELDLHIENRKWERELGE